jgi:hypothetical protein
MSTVLIKVVNGIELVPGRFRDSTPRDRNVDEQLEGPIQQNSGTKSGNFESHRHPN